MMKTKYLNKHYSAISASYNFLYKQVSCIWTIFSAITFLLISAPGYAEAALENQISHYTNFLLGVLSSHVNNIKYPVGRYIIYSIAILFVIGVLSILKEFYYVWREKTVSRKMQKNYKTDEKLVEIRKDSQKITTYDDKEDIKNRLLNKVKPSSIAYKRVTQMYETVTHHQTFKEQLIDLLSLRSSLPKYISSILIMLGLVGTVIGLTISVKEIQPMISGLQNISDLSSITDMMFNTLSGMETAFSTTVAGLLGTILLSIFLYFYNRYLYTFITEFEGFCIEKITPLFNLVNEEDKMEAWFRKMESLIKTLTSSHGKLEHSSGRFLIATLKMEEFSDHFKKGAESVIDFRKDAKLLIDNMNSLITGIDEKMKDLINCNTKMAGNLEGATNKVSGTASELLKVFDKATGLFGDISKQVAVNEKNLESSIEYLESILKETKENFANYDNKIMEEYINRLKEVGGDFKDTIDENLKGYKRKLDTLSKKEDDMVGVVVEHLALIDNYLSDIGTSESRKINALNKMGEPEQLKLLNNINDTLIKIHGSNNSKEKGNGKMKGRKKQDVFLSSSDNLTDITKQDEV